MPKCEKLVDVGRRQFLRGGAVAAAGAAAATVTPPATAAAVHRARVDYPSARLANIGDLKTNEPLDIEYPDADSPGVLIKLVPDGQIEVSSVDGAIVLAGAVATSDDYTPPMMTATSPFCAWSRLCAWGNTRLRGLSMI